MEHRVRRHRVQDWNRRVLDRDRLRLAWALENYWRIDLAALRAKPADRMLVQTKLSFQRQLAHTGLVNRVRMFLPEPNPARTLALATSDRTLAV